MSIRKLVQSILEGDLQACLPLLDYLKEQQDHRVGMFQVLVGSNLRGIEEAVRECEEYDRPATDDFFRQKIRQSIKLFRSHLRELFWPEMDENPSMHLKNLEKRLGKVLK